MDQTQHATLVLQGDAFVVDIKWCAVAPKQEAAGSAGLDPGEVERRHRQRDILPNVLPDAKSAARQLNARAQRNEEG